MRADVTFTLGCGVREFLACLHLTTTSWRDRALFRRRFLEGLQDLHRAGQLSFFGEHAALHDAKVFREWLAPIAQT
jgi:hypothetical protein